MTRRSPTVHERIDAQTFGTLRIALVAHVPALLESLGCDSARVLRRAGIPAGSFSHPEDRVGYQAVGRLLAESARATGLAHFGILLGEHFEPATALGDVIRLMQNAPTLEAALRALVLHHHLNDSGAVPTLLEGNGRRVTLAHSIYSYDVPGLEIFYDAASAYGMKIMQLLCGSNWRPLRATFARSPPVDLAPYHRMFGPQLRFNANVTALEFPAELLKRPVVGADGALYATLRDDLRRRTLAESGSLAEQVRRALRPMILAGTASASNVAELFLISDRVLRGRLALERTTVRRLLQLTRLEMSLQLLRTTRLSVSEVSAAVGYSDPPSFVRAFRSHFGAITPGEWRAQFMRS